MSKNGGLGSKRIGSMTSKGMGKCDAGTRAEQCGNGRNIKKGHNEYIEKSIDKSFITPEISIGDVEHLASLNKQLAKLELDLNKIREKLIKLNGE